MKRQTMVLIGKRIREARESKKLTQEELAERVGVSRSAVARWELGEIEPKLRHVVALANILEVTADSLLGLCQSETKDKGRLQLSERAIEALGEFIVEIRKESMK